MAPALTLHQGDQQAVYVEHPTEVARRALMAAAEVETFDWAQILRVRLPYRDIILRSG